MTQMQFNFYILFSIWQRIGSTVVGWFSSVLANTSSWKYYLSCVCVFALVRLILSPLLGHALGAGISDSVKAYKESHRYRGKYEPGGKYLKK